MLLASTKPEMASLLCQRRKLLLNSNIRQSKQVPVLEIFMDHCRLRGSQNILLLPSAVEVRQSVTHPGRLQHGSPSSLPGTYTGFPRSS